MTGSSALKKIKKTLPKSLPKHFPRLPQRYKLMRKSQRIKHNKSRISQPSQKARKRSNFHLQIQIIRISHNLSKRPRKNQKTSSRILKTQKNQKPPTKNTKKQTHLHI
jgi:hypothetical protein